METKTEVSDIEDELNTVSVQEELDEQRKLFKKDTIVAMNVLECEYVKTDKIRYNGELYNIESGNSGGYFSKGDTVYLPVFVLEYNGLYKSVTGGWYSSKETANNKLRDLKEYRDSFLFKIDSSSEIIFCKSDFWANKLNDKLNFIESFGKFDSFILFNVSVIAALIANISIRDYVSEYVGLGVLSLAVIPLLIQYGVLVLTGLFKSYSIIDIDSGEVMKSNLLDNSDYTVVEADVSIDESGLKVRSEELDCEWFYRRKSNGLFENGGVKLARNLPVINGSCILTVVDNGHSDSNFISTDGNWWIDTDMTFN